jgi:predicted DNA-binding transcriptional regulator AlpA
MTSLFLFYPYQSKVSRMASRSEAIRLLHRLLDGDVLDIHGVAELVQMRRSSVNTLLVREGSEFPDPIFELRGKNRHPLRLWWREDVEAWLRNRPSNRMNGGAR